MRGSKSRPGLMVGSFLLSALLSAAACLASGTALAQCTPALPLSSANLVPCYIMVQPIDVCAANGSSCAPFNTTSATGVPGTAGYNGSQFMNTTSPNPIGFVVDPTTAASPPPAGDTNGVDITAALLNQLGVNLVWLPMATYKSQINTATNTTFQTLNVTQKTNTAGTCTGSIAGTMLTITSCSSGSVLAAADSLSGTGITTGTIITALGTGSGQAGTYLVNISQTTPATTITATTITFQSQDFLTLSYQDQIAEGDPTFGPPSGALNTSYPFQPLGWPPTVVNMFFVTTLNPPTQQAGGTLYGFSWFCNNGVAISQNTFGFPKAKSSPAPRPDTIAHELGHVLCLDHPIFGAGPYDPYNATTNPMGGVVPVIPTNPLGLECDPGYPACGRNLMTTGSLRTAPTVGCVLAPSGTSLTTCYTTVGGVKVQSPSFYTGTADQVTTASSTSLLQLPMSQQTQVLTSGTGLLSDPPMKKSGLLNPIPQETTKAELGTGGSSTAPIIFDLSGPVGGRPGETLVAWILTLPQEQTFARRGRFDIVSQSRKDLVQSVDYYPDAENKPLMRNIAYYPGVDDNPNNPSIGTAARSPCTSETAECLMVKFQMPGLGEHDSISFSKTILSGGAPITNDDLCKAKITYIFSDGYVTTSTLGRCPAESLPLIASSWRPDPRVSPWIVNTGVLLAQSTSQDAFVVGHAYLNNSASTNAVIGFSHGAPDVTFSVPYPNPACAGATFAGTAFTGDTLCFYSGNSDSNTLRSFLASGGVDATTIVENTPGALDATFDGTVFEFTGMVAVTSGRTFRAVHDDGLQLMIGSQLVIDAPEPASFDIPAESITTGTYSGDSGTFPFDLVYGECCGGEAVLGISLPVVSIAPPPCTIDPATGLCRLPTQTGVADADPSKEGGANLPSCNNTAASGTNNNNVFGTINGNVTVSAIEQCNFMSPCEIAGNLTINGGTVYLNCTVDGNLTENGGSLKLDSSAYVHGNVQIGQPGILQSSAFTIGPMVRIDGNLQIQSLPGGQKGTVCGTQVKGNLQVQNNAIQIEIGGSTCGGDTVSGNLQVNGNSAMTDVSFNTVAGNLQCQGNTNTLTAPFTSMQNTVNGNVQGQCHR
jgi:hypothetical protein